MTKLRFLLFDAPKTALKAAFWVGCIMGLATVAEYIGITVLDGDFAINLKGRMLAFAIIASFTSALFVGYVALSKLGYVSWYRKKRDISEEEFYSDDPPKLQKDWLVFAEKKAGDDS